MANDFGSETRTPGEVQDEIGQTRAELDVTLGEIGRRLSAEELKERALAYTRDSVSRAAHAVRQNPGPVALAGIAVAGTLVARRKRRTWARREQAEQIRTIWERLMALSADGDEVSRLGRPMSEVVANLASRARRSLSQAVGDTSARAQRAFGTESVADLAKPAKRLIASIEETSRQNTLLSLAVAAGAGAMLARAFFRR